MEKNLSNLKKIKDNKKNINMEMLEPTLTIYCVRNAYFFTDKDLKMYCRNNNIPFCDTYSIEYFEKFAGCFDVIKMDDTYYHATSADSYGVYNYDESLSSGRYVWNFENGSLEEEYQILKDVGITLENDVYDKENLKKTLILRK